MPTLLQSFVPCSNTGDQTVVLASPNTGNIPLSKLCRERPEEVIIYCPCTSPLWGWSKE